MSNEDEALAEALRQAIQLISAEKGSRLAQAIAPIVLTNLDRGRVHYFLDEQAHHRPLDYAWRVVDHYERWHHYLSQLQEERRAEVWQPLYDKLYHWAFYYLSRRNFPNDGRDRSLHASDCATEAAVRLLYARFPYDADFDPWLSVLLQNVIRKHVEREYKEASLNSVSVDDWEKQEGVLPASPSLAGAARVELRHDLLEAIDQLASAARKQVILLRYFEGYSFQQIAAELDKSDGAVHKLHFDALNNLRKILDDSRDKYE